MQSAAIAGVSSNRETNSSTLALQLACQKVVGAGSPFGSNAGSSAQLNEGQFPLRFRRKADRPLTARICQPSGRLGVDAGVNGGDVI